MSGQALAVTRLVHLSAAVRWNDVTPLIVGAD